MYDVLQARVALVPGAMAVPQETISPRYSHRMSTRFDFRAGQVSGRDRDCETNFHTSRDIPIRRMKEDFEECVFSYFHKLEDRTRFHCDRQRRCSPSWYSPRCICISNKFRTLPQARNFLQLVVAAWCNHLLDFGSAENRLAALCCCRIHSTNIVHFREYFEEQKKAKQIYQFLLFNYTICMIRIKNIVIVFATILPYCGTVWFVRPIFTICNTVT